MRVESSQGKDAASREGRSRQRQRWEVRKRRVGKGSTGGWEGSGREERREGRRGPAAGVGSRRPAGEGAARRRRRPPNFTQTRARLQEGAQKAPEPGLPRRRARAGAPGRDTRPQAPPAVPHAAPGPRPPRGAPGPLRAPGEEARGRRRRPGGRQAEARRSPSFPPFLLAQTQPGRTGPLALCLLLLLHGAMRLGGGSREKRARRRAGRAARMGRGEGGRRAGGGGSGAAAVAAGENC